MITTAEKNNLMDAMANLLDEYDYCYTYDASHTILDEWASQKAPLIEAFKKHPNYVEGKFMIAFDTNYERECDKNELCRFSSYIQDVLMDARFMNNIPEEIEELRKTQCKAWLPEHIWEFLTEYISHPGRTIDDAWVEALNNEAPKLRLHNGEKMSRVVNKVCKYLGYDKHEEYNRRYARYADAITPLTIKRHTILSLNPLDYLTMSFGNSWASCHTIDKENHRGMPNAYEGQYSSGTMSYMLDPSSMVLYTVDAKYEGNEYYTQPKINRQMFHWGGNKLVQGRLYPQHNDGDKDVYEPYRNIVQEIFSIIFDVPNLWTLKRGTSAISSYVYTQGTHYADYCHFNDCTISLLQNAETDTTIYIGAEPICIECGCRHEISENINCCHGNGYRCADCGDYVGDEGIWVNGEVYCSDCVEWCSHCESYHRTESTYIEGIGSVCEGCLEDHFTYCEHCQTYVYNNCSTYIEYRDEYVCDDCRLDYYTECEECGEYFLNRDIHEHNGHCYCADCMETIEEAC